MYQELYDRICEVLHKPCKKADLEAVLREVQKEESKIYEDTVGECRMLSFDTATKRTGWAYYLNGELEASGVIDLSKNKDSRLRVEEMEMRIFQLLSDYNPDMVVIEENSVGRNAKIERMLGHIVGAVSGWARDHYKCVLQLTPSEWRKRVRLKTGIACPVPRNEAKAWSVKMVSNLFHKTVTDDESDAILLGYAIIDL